MRFFENPMQRSVEVRWMVADAVGMQGWVDARVLDVNFETREILVAFDTAGWEDRWVSARDVRGASERETTSVGEETGAAVEMRVSETSATPGHWVEARVRSIKNGFYFVQETGTGRETIVEKEALRRASEKRSLEEEFGPHTQKSEISVASELHKWLGTDEATAVFADIRKKADALFVGRVVKTGGAISESQTGGDGEERDAKVAVIGSPAAQRRAKLLLEVHLKHQRELQLLGERRTARRARQEEMAVAEFQVERSLVGLVIGKGGENVKKVQNKHKVEVQVSDKGAVRIMGEDAANVEAAREELEYVSEQFPIDRQEQVGWILGKGGKNLRDIETKCSLFRARFTENRKSIELVGSRAAVQDAVALLESHLNYLDAFNQVRDENAVAGGGYTQNTRKNNQNNNSREQTTNGGRSNAKQAQAQARGGLTPASGNARVH